MVRKAPKNQAIRFGMVIRAQDVSRAVPKIAKRGIGSFALSFDEPPSDKTLSAVASIASPYVERHELMVNCLTMPRKQVGTHFSDQQCRAWKTLIEHAHHFGTDLVCGIPLIGNSATIQGSLMRDRNRIDELVEHAHAHNTRLAFQMHRESANWFRQGWNIRQGPSMLNMVLQELESPAVGFELEMQTIYDHFQAPLMQVQRWKKRIFHIHWQDASTYSEFMAGHAPGGVCQTTDRDVQSWEKKAARIIDLLNHSDYRGAIDIEEEDNFSDKAASPFPLDQPSSESE